MSEHSHSDIEAALRAALTFDAGASPIGADRLERLLRDVLPFQDRVVELLLIGARAGVPALLASGKSRDAFHALSSDLGLRAEVALWVVDRWAGGMGLPSPIWEGEPASAATGLVSLPSSEARSGSPSPRTAAAGAPTGVGFARVTSDGSRLVFGATDLDGVHVGALVSGATVEWRRVASPTSAFARDVVLRRSADDIVAVWSDHDGVACRTVTAGGDLRLGPALMLVTVPGEEEIRYPLTALTRPGTDRIDLFWTSDRTTLHRSTCRPGEQSDVIELPAPCVGRERLQCLDAHEAEGVGWLAALSDVGRILVSRWDIDVDLHNSWRSAAPPVNAICGVSLATGADGRPMLLALARDGLLLVVDLAGDGEPEGSWRTLPTPERPGGRRYDSLSVADHQGQLTVVVGGGGGVWMWRYARSRHGLRPEGPAVDIVVP